MKSFVRAVLAGLILSAGVLALSGCDQFLPDPLVFTRVAETPVVRMCLPMTINAVELKTYDDADENDHTGTPVWTARGSAVIEEGTEFALGTALEGLEITSGSADPDEVVAALGSEYAISIEAVDSYGEHDFFASIDAGELDEATWVDALGPVESPCLRKPCAPGYACFNQWPHPTGPALAPDPTWSPALTP